MLKRLFAWGCLTTYSHVDPRGGHMGGQGIQWLCRVQSKDH